MEIIKNLKTKYPKDSAGRRMVGNIPTCYLEDKVSDVKEKILKRAQEFETLNYIYVLDKEGKLVGIFSLKELLQKPEETEIKSLMIKEIIKAHPYTDQKKVAFLALKYNLKAIPVVDNKEHFLGVVPSDTILEILHSEHLKDLLKSAGFFDGVYFPSKMMKMPVGILTKTRLPWLLFGLFGGIFAAKIADFFEKPLSTHFALVAFIPLIVYMADAVGTQTQTLIARNLALDTALPFRKYLLKEIKVSLLLGLLLGFILSLVSLVWYQLPYLGVVLGVSLFLTIVAAIFIGSLIPYFLYKFKQDPAIGSGPFATIITDLCSLIIYFSVATILLYLF